MIRFISELLLLLIIIICPWWFALFFAIFNLYYFKFFNEIIIFGLLMDILYGKTFVNFNLVDYHFTIFCLIALISSFYIKKYLKYYNK